MTVVITEIASKIFGRFLLWVIEMVSHRAKHGYIYSIDEGLISQVKYM